jgi:hypothetical protein
VEQMIDRSPGRPVEHQEMAGQSQRAAWPRRPGCTARSDHELRPKNSPGITRAVPHLCPPVGRPSGSSKRTHLGPVPTSSAGSGEW